MKAAWVAITALLCLASHAIAEGVVQAPGAKLRLLDRLTGEVIDVILPTAQAQVFGRLTVQLDECRYPPDRSFAEAYAHLTIMDAAVEKPVFLGWMLASSPGLSALDHPRYDVWVLRCDVPDLDLPDVEAVPTEAPAAQEALPEN
jgi:hypothetical protein